MKPNEPRNPTNTRKWYCRACSTSWSFQRSEVKDAVLVTTGCPPSRPVLEAEGAVGIVPLFNAHELLVSSFLGVDQRPREAIVVRPERPGDRDAARRVNELAFGERTEADLVEA